MVVLSALLLTLAGAAVIYLTSARQGLRTAPLRGSSRIIGWLLVLAGTSAWLYAEGIGAGIAGALTAVMLIWVALPYVAWWCTARTSAGDP